MGGEEEEAKSYDGEKAWLSINHSVLSDLSYFYSTDPTQFIICKWQPQVIYVCIAFAGFKTFTMFLVFLKRKNIKPLRIVVLLICALRQIDGTGFFLINKNTFLFWWWFTVPFKQFCDRRWKVPILENIEKRKTNLKMWHRWILKYDWNLHSPLSSFAVIL